MVEKTSQVDSNRFKRHLLARKMQKIPGTLDKLIKDMGVSILLLLLLEIQWGTNERDYIQ